MKDIIRLVDMDKTYFTKDNQVDALKQINLSIREGEIFGIIGMSGAGKSTLVRCINLLEKPTAGKVYFDDRDLCSLSKKELNETRRSIGMIFQQFNLLMQRNVLKNVRYPLELVGTEKASANARAAELLKVVQLEDKAEAYPSQLSGGQKQRVAIARALASNPKVLLCDEATSALDPKTTGQVLELLKKINKELGITIIVITHEMRVIEEICNRVAIIDESRIAEIGNVLEVFSNPKTEAARKLVYGHKRDDGNFGKGESKLLRLIFDGRSSYEPVIANMILDCKVQVNIMFADTKNIDGNAVGQMVLQIPDEAGMFDKVASYLRDKQINVEEVSKDDF